MVAEYCQNDAAPNRGGSISKEKTVMTTVADVKAGEEFTAEYNAGGFFSGLITLVKIVVTDDFKFTHTKTKMREISEEHRSFAINPDNHELYQVDGRCTAWVAPRLRTLGDIPVGEKFRHKGTMYQRIADADEGYVSVLDLDDYEIVHLCGDSTEDAPE